MVLKASTKQNCDLFMENKMASGRKRIPAMYCCTCQNKDKRFKVDVVPGSNQKSPEQKHHTLETSLTLSLLGAELLKREPFCHSKYS